MFEYQVFDVKATPRKSSDSELTLPNLTPHHKNPKIKLSKILPET